MLAPQTTTTAPMNRAQRRGLAKASKRPAPQRTFQANKPMELLNNCRPYDEAEIAHDLVRIRFAFESLRDGTADTEDFNRVAVAINLAKLRALEIDEILADVIERGQDAMTRCQVRYRNTGRWGFDGPGLAAVLVALDAHEEILTKSSPKQMERSMLLLRDILDKQIANAATAEHVTPLEMKP
jgi:hypothetical protein